ncbi:MAG TPA: hypothetical protein VMU30_09455 [Bacteroidota bacterium]|nr:hypothetical protein [Bacteroidota bacterium]
MLNRKLFFLVLFVMMYVCTLHAQIVQPASSDRHPWWVNLGGGGAFLGNDVTMTAGAIYSYQFESTIISARIMGLTNENPTVQEIHATTVNYKFADYGILYGPIWHFGNGYVATTGGIGLVRAAYERPAGTSTATSFSVPLEVQLGYRITSTVGIGLYPYASINTEKSFWGMMACVQLGIW